MQQEANLAGREQAESQLCKSELCTQQAGQHQTVVRSLSVLISSSRTHDFIATCHTNNLAHSGTWYVVFYFLVLPELLDFLLNFKINCPLFTIQLEARIDSYVRISCRRPQSKQGEGYST